MPRRLAPDRPELVHAVRRAMKLARLETDQTPTEFAEAMTRELGYRQTRQRVNEWETGDRPVRATILLAASRVAGTGLDYLFSEPPSKSKVSERIDRARRQVEGGSESIAQE